MLIPKSPRKPKQREIKCAYEGCKNLFFGVHSAKYCPEHRDPKNRERKVVAPPDVSLNNLVIQHEFKEVQNQVVTCALEGCGVEYEIKIFPRQYVYPKFCPEHRNEHKRKKFLETRS